MEPKPGSVVKAIYDFPTEEPDELSLQVGDIIQILEQQKHSQGSQWSKQWAKGRCVNVEGNFPLGFTVELTIPVLGDQQELFATKNDFNAEEPGDLSFKKGSLVIGKQPVDQNWWLGEQEGQCGIFPLTHAWQLDKGILPKTVTPKRICLHARVKMNMTAQIPQEMDLYKDEIVTITEELEDGWYRGECNGRRGIFSEKFVIVLPQDSTEKSSIGQPSKAAETKDKTAVSDAQNARPRESHYGYDCINSGIASYGFSIHHFQAEFENELSFGEGELINIIRYVDQNWLEGETGGKIGIFPRNFVKIVVDCSNENLPSEQEQSNFPPDTYGRVLFDFYPQLKDDITLRAGDTVTLVRKIDQQWYEVITDSGETGPCPDSYIEIIGSGPDSSPPPYSEVMGFNNSGLDTSVGYFTDSSLSSPKGSSGKGSSFNSSSQSIDDKISESLIGLDSSALSSSFNSSGCQSSNSSFNSSFLADKKFSNTFSHKQDVYENVTDGTESQPRNNLSIFDSPSNHYLGTSVPNIPKHAAPVQARTPTRPPLPNNLSISPAISSTVTLSKLNDRHSSSSSLDSTTDSNATTQDMKDQLEKKQNELKKLKACKNKLQNEGQSNDYSFASREIKSQKEQLTEKINELEIEIKSLQDQVQVRQKNDRGQKNGPAEQVSLAQEKEQKRRDEAKILKMKEQRECVILELLQTEKDYISDLELLHRLFLENPEEARGKGVNVIVLFGNLDEVIALANRLLQRLRAASRASGNSQNIGECFVSMSDEMKEAYGHYCRNHDEVNSVLDKFDENSAAGRYLKHKVECLRRETNCFDLPSMLIKPVQRILKYPLLLNELLKCTAEDHPDKSQLIQAIGLMTDVATAINEFKRKKDLVFKYRKQADTSLSGRISKLSLHSMLKKSSRLGMRLSSSIGLKSVAKDPEFEKLERQFVSFDKTLRIFLKDLNTHSAKLEEFLTTALNMSEAIVKLYQDRKSQQEVQQFFLARKTILDDFFQSYKKTVETNVNSPIKVLLQTFQGPHNLIQKRYDKLLDYEACTSKMEKNRDVTKSKMLQDNQLMAKNTYEALNSQLIDDLPKLYSLSVDIFNDCIRCFLKAKKTFLDRTAQHMSGLLELPLFLGSKDSNILSTFQVKHTLIVDQLAQLSIVPKQFQSCIRTDSLKRNSSPRGSARLSFGSSSSTSKSQNSSQQICIKSAYPPSNIYAACQNYDAVDLLDISLKKGDIVGVIKQQDPMGNKSRWFVDNGDAKGFVPAKHLIMFLSPDGGQSARKPGERSFSVPSTSTAVNPPTFSNNPQPRVSDARSSRTMQPIRPAPPLTRNRASTIASCSLIDMEDRSLPQPSAAKMAAAISSVSSHQQDIADPDPCPRYEEIEDLQSNYGRYDMVAFEEESAATVAQSSSAASQSNPAVLNEFDPYANPKKASDLYDNVPDNLNCLYTSHRYEDIPDDINYGVIANDSQHTQNYYFALYEFSPTGENQLPLKKGQVVLVLHQCDLNSNTEWWFVEDRYGKKGYVPGAYLNKYLEGIGGS